MRTILLAAMLFAIGCGGSQSARETIPLSEVPESVMAIAKEKLPGVTFDKAWRKKNGEYEISGKDKNGKIREIDLKPDGTVTELE